VNHGPFVVDNNIFLSPVSIRTQSEGGAYLHNLIAGSVFNWPDLTRFTPYFLPHSTDMGALTIVAGGDDRFYNNIFVGQGIDLSNDTTVIVNPWDPKNKYKFGLKSYNQVKLPVWMSGNVYYYGAKPSEKDLNMLVDQTFDPDIKLREEGENVYLQMSFSQGLIGRQTRLITSDILGKARIPKARFENPDGSDMKADSDYFGKKRPENNPSAGPFESPGQGTNKWKVW
jgi:hypothetical protein